METLQKEGLGASGYVSAEGGESKASMQTIKPKPNFGADDTEDPQGSPCASGGSPKSRGGRRRSRFDSRRSFAESVRSSVGSIARVHSSALEHFAGAHDEGDERLLGDGGSEAVIERTTDLQTVLTLIKAFAGPAHLYLAKGLANSGVWLGLISLFACAGLNALCVMLLVQVKRKVVLPGYSEMGAFVYGRRVRQMIDVSLVLSQFGLATMYYIFVSETVRDAIANLVDCAHWAADFPLSALILVQVLLQLPISWVQQIRSIAFFAIVADVMVIFGIFYCIIVNSIEVAKNGFPDADFAHTKFPMFFGAAVLAFEGIGVMMPIHEAMENPSHFIPCVWTAIMICCVLFAAFAFVGYGARGGRHVETNVLLAMPQDTLSQMAKLAYCIAVFFSFSLQAFPAYRIIERSVGMQRSKPVLKNLLRSILVTIMGLIAWAGADNLGNFVALVGGLTMCPLAFVFPSLLHYKAVAETRTEKILDLVIMGFGIACMLLSSGMAVQQWAAGESDSVETCVGNGAPSD